MTSTPDNGDSVQQHAEQAPDQTDLQDEAPATISQTQEIIEDVELQDQDGDELAQFNQQDTADEDPDLGSLGLDEGVEQNDRGLVNNVDLRVQSPSIDDTASVPDDTPSVQDSLPSSPQSRASTPQIPNGRRTPSTSRRPFDLRFQSRLSSSSISPRASSPAFLTNHSRQSSLASFGFRSVSEPDDSEAPWEVIRWHKLSKLSGQVFSEAARRNFGSPTCLAVTDQIVVGTSKGIVLVFDYQQNHKAIIGSGTKAIECGAVVSLAISADHTTVAAGHATGHIFTWEIGRSSRPFLHIPPIDNKQPGPRSGDGHVDGSCILHVGFLGFRRTALVSADDRGMAFSHLASRGTGALGRTVKTTRILGRYPDLITRAAKPVKKSSVLAFSPLPLGNVEQNTDSLGLVAMLTPYLLVIVSTTPVAQTQHKSARPKEIAAHGAMTAALAWFPAIKLKGSASTVSRSKLAYAWSDILVVLEVHESVAAEGSEKEKPPDLQFLPRSRYKAEEAIVAIQWLSRSVLAVLTITQQLLIIEDVTMTVTDAFDLLPKNLYHADVYSHQLQAVIENLDEEDTSMHGVVADAYHMSFRAYKGRLFLFGHKNVWWGSLTNWADRLLAMMDAGDFIGAIRLATNYYAGVGEKVTIGLPEDHETRIGLVQEKLLAMISASLKYAFGEYQKARPERPDEAQLLDLAVACVAACLTIGDYDFLFDEVFVWYDDHGKGTLFIDVLEPHILDGKVVSLPPTAFKVLINHFMRTHTSTKLEEIICLLDPTSMDIDQVTSLCKDNGLWDAYIYVWNAAMLDYTSPLQELLDMIVQFSNASVTDGERNNVENAYKIFAYLSFVLTSRVYPTGAMMDDNVATDAKLQVYDFLFSGSDNTMSTSHDLNARASSGSGSGSFPRLRSILRFDTPSFVSAMNEAFEDSFLNTGAEDETAISPGITQVKTIYNRQFIVQILLGVMSAGFEHSERVYVDMFVARNLPKYPQYILLPGSVLHDTFMRLCEPVEEGLRDDAQLSVEYLLSVYQPPNILDLTPALRNAQYYRVLKSVFKQEHRFADLIQIYFLDPDGQGDVFVVITECLHPGSSLTAQQREDVVEMVKDHALDLSVIDAVQTATVIDDVLPEAHQHFVNVQEHNPAQLFKYLKTLFEPEQSNRPMSGHVNPSLLELYIRLMCQHNALHVTDYVKTIKEGDLNLDSIVPDIEASGVIDAAVVLLANQGQVRAAMNRLLTHISALQATLKGVLDNAADSPDAVGTNETIEDLLESIDRYSGVGIWICQGQSKATSGPKAPKKSSSGAPLSFGETLWLDLLVTVVNIAQEISSPPTKVSSPEGVRTDSQDGDEVTKSIRSTIQKLFTALLNTTASSKPSLGPGSVSASSGLKSNREFTFLRILRAFLTSAASTSPSLSQLRSVISYIFSAYAYEESLLSLSNAMLDKDLFVHVDEVSKLRQQGWRPRGQICEVCRRRVWGPGTGLKVWSQWEKKEKVRYERRLYGYSNDNAIQEDDLDEHGDRAKGKGKGRSGASGTANGKDSKTGSRSTSVSASRARSPSSASSISSDDQGTTHHERQVDDDDGGDERKDDGKARNGSGAADDPPSGPVVVFSCRHIYHRSCLIGIDAAGAAGTGVGVGDERTSSLLTPDLTTRLTCPSCP